LTDPLRDQPWGRTDFRMFDPDGVYVRVTGQRPVPTGLVPTGRGATGRGATGRGATGRNSTG
jgi:hypothetical protein